MNLSNVNIGIHQRKLSEFYHYPGYLKILPANKTNSILSKRQKHSNDERKR